MHSGGDRGAVAVQIAELSRAELQAAAVVAARALRDNPTSLAVLEGEAWRRERSLYALCHATLASRRRLTLVARHEGGIAGVLCTTLPGFCAPSFLDQVRLLPFLFGDLRRSLRLSQQQAAWARWHPGDRHYHLGPVGVEPALQGMGIGSQLMAVLCARVDAASASAYLETDTPENVRFYQRFRFAIIGEVEALGARTWFMRRVPEGYAQGREERRP